MHKIYCAGCLLIGVAVSGAALANGLSQEPTFDKYKPLTSDRAIPKGFSPVWTDDRLNPLRGKGTEAGEASMNAMWTTTVPRRLRAAKQ